MRAVVVCHVVELAEEVVLAVHDGGGVHHRNGLAVAVELDKAVEADVDECQEEGHTQQRLNVEPEQEGCAAGGGQDSCGHGPVDAHAAEQLLRQVLLAIGIEEHDRRVSHHMQQHTVHVNHVPGERGTVEVPHVEGVARGTVQAVVDEHVRRGEVIRDVTEDQTYPILNKVAEYVFEPFLVHSVVVALFMRKGVCSTHYVSTYAHP
mmetsp:Transcript_18891/g.26010  ORF Transcript_18891/g.26010 Transcript_18891/m.26010 type:complete len:206 (-) Transcript_18891:679-1296(-)